MLSEQEDACHRFFLDVRRAQSAVAVKALGLIGEAAEGGQLIRERTLPNGTVEREYAPIDWRAADKLLVRVLPREYAESAQLQLTGAGGGPLQVSHTIEALAARLEDAAARRGEPDVLPDADGHDVVAGEVTGSVYVNGSNGVNGHANGHVNGRVNGVNGSNGSNGSHPDE